MSGCATCPYDSVNDKTVCMQVGDANVGQRYAVVAVEGDQRIVTTVHR